MLFTHFLFHSENHQFMKRGLCIRSEKRIVRTEITGVYAENGRNTRGKYVEISSRSSVGLYESLI